ncbi:MAG: CubicO group peptidase (beta-lactamase class C family) [Rhodothermales bacterium]|jgi:CubicO group peptidase (beta-lactamase class C family)
MSKSVLLALLSLSVFAQGPSCADVLQPFVDKHELAGAVAMVVGPDRVLSTTTVGFADIAKGEALKPDAIFWIASQTKGITAAAVMMLVDEDKLTLDDEVRRYLPEFKTQQLKVEVDGKTELRAPSRPITIRDVLSHVSGMPFKSDVEHPTLDSLPLAEAVHSYAKTPLDTEPGTHYQYSNAGINTAARVLEVISGQAYEDYLQARLFKPLGMRDTSFWLTEAQLPRLALAYRENPEKTGLASHTIGQLGYPLTSRENRFPMPAGGLFSTAADTARFCQMLLNGGSLDGKQYLSADAFRALTSRQTPKAIKNSYGLGLSVGGDSFGHGGAYATNMDIRPRDGFATIWMVQHSGFHGDGKKAQGAFKNWARKTFGK